jgi:thiol-disulfide isomerase/thioredoxin
LPIDARETGVSTLLRASLLAALMLGAGSARANADIEGRPQPSCPALAGPTIASQLAGQVVVVDFWASWCPPCRKLMPFLNELYGEHRSGGLRVVAVNIDTEIEQAQAHLRRVPVEYPIVFDPDGACPTAFALPAMPSTYVIDRDGIVRYVHAGFRAGDRQRLRAAIEKLLPP